MEDLYGFCHFVSNYKTWNQTSQESRRIAAVHMCCIDEGFKAGFECVIVV
jgi:hypothetical protein